MHLYRLTSCAAGLMILALSVPGARAQQQDPNQQQQPQQNQEQSAPPIPAYRSPLASAADNGDANDMYADPQKLIPDDHALAGAENLGLGLPSLTHSYWQPHLDLLTTVDSNAAVAPGQTGWSTWTSVMGGLDLRRTSGNSDLTLSYLGGGMLSNSGNVSNGIVQGVDFKDKLSFRRSSVTFIDQFNYMPGSLFGFAGLGNVQVPGSTGLGQSFTPGQTSLTSLGQNLTNSFVTEVDTYLTPRSTISLVGGYSVLHFFDGGLLDYGNANGQIGYNYQLNRSDTIAISYQFSAYRYSNSDQSINNNTVMASYGHRVTGRLAFQVAAGPDFTVLREPITGGSGTTGDGGTGTGSNGSGSTSTVGSSIHEVYWTLNTSLRYQLQRGSLGLTYTRGVSGGSGLLAGSVSNSVSGTANRQLSRTTGGGLNFGFSHNTGLSVSTSTPTNQSYGYWFGGANLTRPWGRTLNLSLSYQMQYQDSNSSFCIGPTCGTNVMRHVITFDVGWHGRPLTIE
jgi:hypothetical protein